MVICNLRLPVMYDNYGVTQLRGSRKCIIIMKKLYSVLWALGIIFPLTAQNFLEGNVVDSLSGEPLPSAYISVDNTYHTAFTDAKGYFRINGIKNGEYTLRIKYLGYKDYSTMVVLKERQTINIVLQPLDIFTDPAEVMATKAAEYAPISQTNLTAQQIENKNLGKDLPYLLDGTPNVVTYSDAGAGVGYTGLRIRGSDATRINVTINGIPVNDAESQGVFWVNTPDISSSLSSVQIQRGVGTSTNGAGAFGATLNLSTNEFNPQPFAQISSSAGFFNTFKNTIELNSGLIGNHFVFSGRLSKITSDGYVDRGWSDLKSFYVSGGYFGKNTTVKFNIFSGKENTYQAWNGLIEDSLATNRTYNSAGTDSGTKNPPYENETDNYQQDYYQLFITQNFGKHWNLNIAGHYTRGKGYYEQYKTDRTLADYQIDSLIMGTDTITTSDLIRQLWLDNHYAGGIFSLNYQRKKWKFTIGGSGHYYTGHHYGRVIWARYAVNSEFNHEYYNNPADKLDMNVYAKADYEIIRGLKVFADLQYRFVNYHINGFTDNPGLTVNETYHFFNPKAGISYDLNSNNRFYAYFGVANKEPNRVDFETSTANRPQHETLRDLEVGYTRRGKIYQLTANVFWMDYTNQLVISGKINDVGAYTRTNAPSSYRLGIEVDGSVKIVKRLRLDANLALSLNKIKNFTEYVDNYDTGVQDEIVHGTTDISFSPPIVGFISLNYEPINRLNLNVAVKYVDRQFMDNTSNTGRMLNRFSTGDFQVTYDIPVKKICMIGLRLSVYNFFNTMYEPNGYTFSYIYGGQSYTENYYYPQAGIHLMGGITLKFMQVKD